VLNEEYIYRNNKVLYQRRREFHCARDYIRKELKRLKLK